MVVLDWCYMCKKCRESVYHLFLYCLIAYELWSMVFDLFGTHWVMPYKIIELLVSWQGKFGRHRNTDFGVLCQIVYFGGSGMLDILRTLNGQSLI